MAIINKKDEPVKAKKGLTEEEEYKARRAEIERVQDSTDAALDAEIEAIDAKNDSIRVSKGMKPRKRESTNSELRMAESESMPNALERFFDFANENAEWVYPLLGVGADALTGGVRAGIPKTRTVEGGWTPNAKKNMGKLWRLGNLTSTAADISFLRRAFPDLSLTKGIEAAKQVAWKPFTDNIKNAFFEPTIGKNVSIETPGKPPETPSTRRAKVFNINRSQGIVPQNVSKLFNMPKPKLNLKPGVGALAAFALNDQLNEFRENPDRSFGENVRSGLENTALGFSPSSLIGGAGGIFNAISEASDKLPMQKGELLSKVLKAIGGGLEKAGNWTYEKERDIFDPVGQEYYRRRKESDKGSGVISQTKSDFKKEFRGEKESPLGSAVTGMDLFNVGTKGISTKKGVESFDNMLVELGYNPNELTTKQKVSMMKRGKGLIQKK